MSHQGLLREWEADWKLAGHADSTMRSMAYVIAPLLAAHDVQALDLATVKAWVADGDSAERKRFRGRTCRAFFRWATEEEIVDANWWKRIPLAAVAETPQPTITTEDYKAALAKAKRPRDKALIEVLWCAGMRCSELLRMEVEHLDFDAGVILVPQSKTGVPRLAPLSPAAAKALRLLMRKDKITTGRLWRGQRGLMTNAGVRDILCDLGAPAAHAWRRGWAVESLRAGISQVSLQYAGGWRSAAMVARYTKTLAQELSMAEFQRRWTA